MDGKEMFGAAVRVIGLVGVARGFLDLMYVFRFVIGALDVSVTASFPDANVIYGIVYFFGGLYCLRGAPIIVNYAYPVSKQPDSKVTQD